MKNFKLLLPALFAVFALVACEPDLNNPDECPSVSGSFPRKHLLEHFTGEQCGYCPGGMSAIVEALDGQEDRFIWVSHHYGYGKDEFYLAGNEAIGKKLKVQGAPSMSMDRTKVKYDSKSTAALAFHPGYLPEIMDKFTDNTSFVSVALDNSFDASSRSLRVNVSGQCENADVKTLLLTVLVKESGMVGKQADYETSWGAQGWTKFRHTKTVRAFLSDALGDSVFVKKGQYSAEYTFELPDKWDANNCTVVAFLTWPNGFMPVLNAEQAPVVAGTKGGEDLLPEGITMRTVSDKQCEETSAPAANVRFSYSETTFVDGYVELFLQSDSVIYFGQNRYPVVPVAVFYLKTGSSALVPGTYTASDADSVGSLVKGHHRANEMVVDGSYFLYAYQPYLQQGYLYDLALWMVADGELVVTEDAVTFSLTNYNGHSFSGTCPLSPAAVAPLKSKGLRPAAVRAAAVHDFRYTDFR